MEVQLMSSEQILDKVKVRRATAEDAVACGQICFDAFNTINQSHGFPSDFPNLDAATQFISMLFSHHEFYCVVAEIDGRIVGSNCLNERSTIAGVGPITIDPQVQNRGVGRLLMQAVLDRATESRAAGVRLIQAAFHSRSLSLYASLGFDIREPICCMQGRTVQRTAPGCTVRPAQSTDMNACKVLAIQAHGFDRGKELAEGIEHGTAVIVERGGRITGYSSLLGSFGHSTAETNVDLQALIASADSFPGAGILVPSRNSALLRWCLANGLRIAQPMTLMTIGLYNEPEGAYLPSVFY
jgi:predicted N-acetyltransferase YhbS